MPSPFVAQGGRIRRSPLQEAVASSRGASNANTTANRASNIPNSSPIYSGKPQPLGDSNNPSDSDIENASKLAEAGDQQAIDWLKTAGLVTGAAATAAGGYYLNKALRNRSASKKGPTKIGADNIAVAAQTGNESTTVAKKPKKTPDLYIDLPSEAVRDVTPILPRSAKTKIPKFNPTIAADAMKAVRRLP